MQAHRDSATGSGARLRRTVGLRRRERTFDRRYLPPARRARDAPGGRPRSSADDKIAPRAAEVDETGEFPQDVLRRAAQGRPPRRAHPGGVRRRRAPTRWPPCIVIEEVARACASSSLIPAVNKLGTMPLLLSGVRGAQAAVPAAGRARRGDVLLRAVRARRPASDAAAMRTRAVRDGDHWVLNGAKRWITNAGVSEYYTVMAVDRPGRRRERHLRVRRGEGRRGLLVRRQGEEARHQGLADPRGLLRRLPHPGRPDHRRAGHRLQDRAAHAGPHPGHDRRAGGRHRAGRARRGARLRQGAQAVRQGDRGVPGHPVHARRHGDEDRGGPAADVRARPASPSAATRT